MCVSIDNAVVSAVDHGSSLFVSVVADTDWVMVFSVSVDDRVACSVGDVAPSSFSVSSDVWTMISGVFVDCIEICTLEDRSPSMLVVVIDDCTVI